MISSNGGRANHWGGCVADQACEGAYLIERLERENAVLREALEKIQQAPCGDDVVRLCMRDLAREALKPPPPKGNGNG